MRRVFWLGVGGALVAWGLSGALGGCGGDSAAIADGDAGAGASSSGDPASSTSSSSGGSSSSSSSSSSSGDLDGGLDGGGDASSSSSSGGTSTPGTVPCGTTSCTLANDFCCSRPTDGGVTSTCDTTCKGTTTFSLRCDEGADCGDAGARCCLGFTGTYCASGCISGVRLCKTTADCGDAGACAEKTCGSRKLFVCGTPSACQ